MAKVKFFPAVVGLEDRTVPSASPAEVVAAFARTAQTTAEVRGLADTLGAPRTTGEFQFIATRFRALSDQSLTDAGVLNEYLSDLTAQVTADPSLTSTVGPFVGQVNFAVTSATVNALYADVFALGFGGSPRVPPPVPPPVDFPVNFGPDPAPTTTSPPATASPPAATSSLPFSLSDPSFRTLPSGTRVWDVTPGSGATVAVGDTITARYTGYLTDGTIFDTNNSFQTVLNNTNLIQGFVDGLDGIQVGGTRRLFIPAAQAYGSQTRPGIPANSDLVFEVAVLSSP